MLQHIMYDMRRICFVRYCLNSIFAVAFSQFVDGGLNDGIDYAAVVAVNDSHAGTLGAVLERNQGEAGSVTETMLL